MFTHREAAAGAQENALRSSNAFDLFNFIYVCIYTHIYIHRGAAAETQHAAEEYFVCLDTYIYVFTYTYVYT